MDQKKQIVARLQKKFSGSSLSGDGTGENTQVGETAAADQVAQPDGRMSEEKKAMARLADKIAHLDPLIRGQVEQLINIERNFPIRGFLTDDQLRAGIIVASSVRGLHWPEFCRYSELFFGPAHETICTVFKNELQAVARRYGKNAKYLAEVEPDAE